MEQPQHVVRLTSRDRLTAIPHQSDGPHGSNIGPLFLDSLLQRDRDGMLRLLAPRVRLHAVAPDHTWESQNPLEIVDDILLGDFFGPDVVIEKLHSADFGNVADINSASYFVQLRRGDRLLRCQQHLFLDVDAGQVRSIHLSCSGMIEVPTD